MTTKKRKNKRGELSCQENVKILQVENLED